MNARRNIKQTFPYLVFESLFLHFQLLLIHYMLLSTGSYAILRFIAENVRQNVVKEKSKFHFKTEKKI